jgi:L-asparaginase / beta-aspartyl-peptidase
MIALALHGGAGDSLSGGLAEQREILHQAATEALALLRGGGSALEAVERMVQRLEDCPLFNAGIGAVLNRDGVPELDAAIMDGLTLACGAVAGVCRARSPVRLARAVMERSPHVLFAGDGADALNRELGLEEVTPDFFVTEPRFRQLKDAHARGVIALDHDAAFGTVGAVARDAAGNLAAATSTGGLTNKHPGRVGDSPLPGAGTYADNRSVAVSCTGTGECFIRTCFGHEVHARVAYCGWTLPRACDAALADVQRLGGHGGCIAIDRAGRIATPFNSNVMFRAWARGDGPVHVGVEREDGFPEDSP